MNALEERVFESDFKVCQVYRVKGHGGGSETVSVRHCDCLERRSISSGAGRQLAPRKAFRTIQFECLELLLSKSLGYGMGREDRKSKVMKAHGISDQLAEEWWLCSRQQYFLYHHHNVLPQALHLRRTQALGPSLRRLKFCSLRPGILPSALLE